eukprot:5693592-Amphidinium_carterae.1
MGPEPMPPASSALTKSAQVANGFVCTSKPEKSLCSSGGWLGGYMLLRVGNMSQERLATQRHRKRAAN